MRVDARVPSLAATLAAAGFATGGFVGAFPLDRRFGLNAGFATYGDRMPRGAQGRPANERAGSDVADEAIAWLRANAGSRALPVGASIRAARAVRRRAERTAGERPI